MPAFPETDDARGRARVRSLGVSIAALLLLALLAPNVARAADRWRFATAAGYEAWLTPEVGSHGWFLADATLSGVAGGRLHFMVNTETALAGIEGIRLADGQLELSAVARGEALLAGLLTDYYVEGSRRPAFGFNASYVWLIPSLKWHAAPSHSIEAVASVRRWFFGGSDETAEDLVLPPDMVVFEPRLRYTLWRIRAPAREWEAHRFYPRVEGIAVGVELGVDVRSENRAWGGVVDGQLDPRNDPGSPILIARQWLRAGISTGSLVRFQLEQHGSWGQGEDDLTRNRVGGMNPYVVSIPGLPWAALLSERLVAGRLSLHLRLGESSRHELGAAMAGGAFNDVRRAGDIDDFGGAGGLETFADLRFGDWQIDARLGWAFPAEWQGDPPHLSALATVGVSFD